MKAGGRQRVHLVISNEAADQLNAIAEQNAEAPGRSLERVLADATAELFGKVWENQQSRGEAVFAPVAFEDEDEPPRQSLPMDVVRGWFS
jgi:hypothetical protein